MRKIKNLCGYTEYIKSEDTRARQDQKFAKMAKE